MPRGIQTGEQAIELAQQFGIKGKLDLRLDETIVPVREVGRASRTGSRSGFFWQRATQAHAIAGGLSSTLNPYARIPFLDTPGAQDPSEATHDVWLMAVACHLDNGATFTEAMASLIYPVAQPEGPALLNIPVAYWNDATTGTIAFPPVASGGTARFHGLGTAPFLGICLTQKLPLWVAPPTSSDNGGLGVASVSSGALEVFLDALWWAGPKGTAPPV